MSSEQSEVFVLTTDILQDYQGDIVRFPRPVGACAKAYNYKEAFEDAYSTLRKIARQAGANAVIGTRIDCQADGSYRFVHLSGTPVFLDPPLVDPDEYIKNLKDSAPYETRS